MGSGFLIRPPESDSTTWHSMRNVEQRNRRRMAGIYTCLQPEASSLRYAGRQVINRGDQSWQNEGPRTRSVLAKPLPFYSVRKNPIKSLSLFHGRRFFFPSLTSQLANALAFISKSTSAYTLVVVSDT